MLKRFTMRLMVILSAALLSASAAMAQQECTLENMRTGERPAPADGGPTVITASFVVADFLGVDDASQQIDVDIRSNFSWTDPRLADFSGCRFGVTSVWFPEVSLFNSSNLRGLRKNARNQVIVEDGGRVVYHQRVTGSISSYHNLKRFPFDSQNFEISMGTIDDAITEVTFIANDEDTWIAEKLNIEGWDVLGVRLATSEFTTLGSEMPVSKLSLTISAVRSPDYFLYRVMLLLSFVVCMSWVIFWIPPSRFEFQIGLGATSMLTSIAFNLSVASNLPKLSYLTILDKAIIWSIFLIFLSIVEALVAGLLVLRGAEHQAIRLDRVSRVLFPAMLIIGWLFMYQTS